MHEPHINLLTLNPKPAHKPLKREATWFWSWEREEQPQLAAADGVAVTVAVYQYRGLNN